MSEEQLVASAGEGTAHRAGHAVRVGKVTAWDPVSVRPGLEGDLSFVEDAWSKAAVKDRGGPLGERWVRVDGGRLLLAPNEWHEMRRARIRALLGRSAVLVGHRADAPDVVWAWLVFDVEAIEGTTNSVLMTLHWVWTRPELRRRGYAREMVASARRRAGVAVDIHTRCSHMTSAGQAFLARVGP
jgi:GNAT superfamily N-acetyltransferase